MDERKDGVVIDPYCGSGTTLVAARILGHNFIGIEIAPEYVRYAEDRLRDYKTELRYANEEIAQHVVTKTFRERKERGEFTGKYRKLSDVEDNGQRTLALFGTDETVSPLLK